MARPSPLDAPTRGQEDRRSSVSIPLGVERTVGFAQLACYDYDRRRRHDDYDSGGWSNFGMFFGVRPVTTHRCTTMKTIEL